MSLAQLSPSLLVPLLHSICLQQQCTDRPGLPRSAWSMLLWNHQALGLSLASCVPLAELLALVLWLVPPLSPFHPGLVSFCPVLLTPCCHCPLLGRRWHVLLQFTPKYSTVGYEGGVLGFFLKFQTYSLGHSWAHEKFQNRSFISSWLNLKFTPKCSTVGCEGGY